MQSETNISNDYKVHVICPKCNKSDYILIPKGTLSGSGRGLTKILVPDTTICEDSFQIFVDKNGAVRGYETPDFELKFNEVEETKEELGEKGTLQVLKTLFGDEIFYKAMRTAFTNNTIYCITEDNYIVNNFRKFFIKIFGDLDIHTCTLEEYNSDVRKEIFATKYKHAILFNSDLQAIVKQPFKGNYDDEKFMLEKSIIDAIDFSEDDEEIIESLVTAIGNIYYAAEQIQKDITNESIKNKKDFETRLKSLTNSWIRIDHDIMAEILRLRYNYDWEKKVLKVDEKLRKLNSLF